MRMTSRSPKQARSGVQGDIYTGMGSVEVPTQRQKEVGPLIGAVSRDC